MFLIAAQRNIFDVHMLMAHVDEFHKAFTAQQYGEKFAANLESDMIFDISMAAVRLLGSLTQSKKRLKDLYDFFKYFNSGRKYDERYVEQYTDEKESFIALVEELSTAMRSVEGEFTSKSVDEVMVYILEKHVEQIKNVSDPAAGSIGFVEVLRLLAGVTDDYDGNDALNKLLYSTTQTGERKPATETSLPNTPRVIPKEVDNAQGGK